MNAYCTITDVKNALGITATTDDGMVMGVRHRQYVVEGVQFHPESIMTDTGHEVLKNFLSYLQPRWPQD